MAESSSALRVPVSAQKLCSFAQALLRAFHEAEQFAQEQGGVSSNDDEGWIFPGFPLTYGPHVTRRSTAVVSSEKSHRQLQDLYTACIRRSVDALCDLLLRGASSLPHRERRIEAAMSESRHGSNIEITSDDLIQLLSKIADAFREQHDTVERSRSSESMVSSWNPEWRTQNIVWKLLRKLGNTMPPAESLVQPFNALKETAFSCLFRGDYLSSTRKKCKFRQSLLQYLPYPGKWDADMTWIGTATFISLPVASLAHSWDDGNRLAAFWTTLFSLFAGIATTLLFLFASYRSKYSNSLLDRAARGTQHERNDDGLFATINVFPSIEENLRTTIDTVRNRNTVDITESKSNTNTQPFESSDDAALANDLDHQPRKSGSLLHLYQASMFVERIYGSKYLDESWLLGLSERQLYDAVILVVQAAGTLGVRIARQYGNEKYCDGG